MKELKIIFSLLILIMMFATWLIIFRATNFYVKKQRIWIEAYEKCAESSTFGEEQTWICIHFLNGGGE